MNSIRSILGTKKTLTWSVVILMMLMLKIAGVIPDPPRTYAAARSDFNRDGIVDLEDLKLFSETKLNQDWQTVDWCAWIKEEGKLQNRYDHLVDFIREYFQCDAPPPPPPPPPVDPLEVKNILTYPTRLAWGPDGKLYVSDAKVGSVFIFTLTTDTAGLTTLQLTGELKKVFGIVGVAVDNSNLIYVGNSHQKRIDKYNLQAELVASFGQGTLRAPSDLTFDSNQNLYVADPQSDVVWVFKPDGSLLRTIRKGGMKNPMGVEITYVDDGAGHLVGELFVADKTNYLVKVFDLQGNLLRSYGGFVEKVGMMGTSWNWEGKFAGLQSLAIDQNGYLHALDTFMGKVQILDPVTGVFISAYADLGTEPGLLKLPLDIVISSTGKVIVANTDNRRVEILYTVQ